MEKAQEYYDRIIDWLNRRGFENIKANVEGFETPSGFKKKGDGELLVPDVSAQNHHSKYYSEISMKPKDKTLIQDIVSKWKLLSMVADIKGGGLYLFAPYGNKSFTTRLLDRYDINAEVFFLKKKKIKRVS